MSEFQKKTVNGREIEHKDVIIHSVTTRFSFMDRIRILLGSECRTNSHIYTKHEEAMVCGSEATTYISPIFRRKPKQMGLQKVDVANENPMD